MKNDYDGKKIARLEALLFIYGEPLSFEKISSILEIENDAVFSVLGEYGKKLDSEDRGLALIIENGKAQLVSKPEFSSIIEVFVKNELQEELTPASLEAVSMIAYLGPISKSRIDYLRGVNSGFILRNLLLRGLIERSPDPKRPNSHLYFPSFDLLRHLGLQKKEDLPDFENFRSLLLKLEPAPESQSPSSEEKSNA